MIKTAIFFCAGAAVLLGLGPGADPGRRASNSARAVPVGIAALPLAEGAGCVLCDRCTGSSHIAIAHDEGTRTGQAHACGAQEELLRGHPARVFFNQEHRSLQVVGCRGETTANVPLSTVFAASLAQAQAQ